MFLRATALCAAAAALAAGAFAGDHLWVVREHYAGSTATLGSEGIWRFDPLARTYARAHPLFYNTAAAASGAALVASGDRLILQGPAYVEFDVTPVRVVRRYRGLPDSTGRWSGALYTRSEEHTSELQSPDHLV